MRTILRLLKWIGIGFLTLIALFGVVYMILPKNPKEIMPYEDRTGATKSLVKSSSYAAVTGTPWATQAALDILAAGGNAYDAAVAALLTLNVTNGVHASFPSVAPLMIYDATSGAVRSYIGAGKAPAAATIDAFKKRGFETIPPADIWSQLLPASPDVAISLLRDYGSMSFSEVSKPAIMVAREGFPATIAMLIDMGKFSLIERMGYSAIMPYNAQVFMNKIWWRPIALHERMRFPDLADTFQHMADAEAAAINAGKSRQEGLQSVRDYFYKGQIAQQIVAFHQKKNGLFSLADLANYAGDWEDPVTGSYGEYTFYTNQGWSQGMVGPLALQILEGIDLKDLGHNSAEYVHMVVQAIELAQADRDAYVGDPAFVNVPVQLMSKAYAAQRRSQMTDHAFGPLPAPGVIAGMEPDMLIPSGQKQADMITPPSGIRIGQDTTQLAVVDSKGNVVVMTPSDFPWTPMIPGTGLNLGNRMNQFRLNPNNPDSLQPGKRPRITPHAMIVFKDTKFFMAYSTPGGDMQPQALIQVFLNMQVFGMDLQKAITAPRFYTVSAPSSFAPHEAKPGTIRLEADLFEQSAGGLQNLGYTLVKDPKWTMDYGGVGAILRGEDNALYAGADPRWETWADGK